MDAEEKRIIEINGLKMEVDLRNAKVIDQYKVGDNIKVLVKEYTNDYRSYVGTIIGFDNFQETPTVVIAYLKTDYGTAEIKYAYFNKQTKEFEITNLNDWDIPVTKIAILKKFDSMVEVKEKEIEEIKNRKVLFETLFGKFFSQHAGIEVV